MNTHLRFPAALGALLVTVACGGGANNETPVADTTPAAQTVTPAAPAAINGEAEYQAVCMVCHQADGKGLPGVYPPLAGSEWVNGDPNVAIAIVIHGLQGEITVAGQTFSQVMAAWGQLSDAQIAAILTHERSSWGNSAAAVTPEQVAAVRSATSSRTLPWTVAELKAAKLN